MPCHEATAPEGGEDAIFRCCSCGSSARLAKAQQSTMGKRVHPGSKKDMSLGGVFGDFGYALDATSSSTGQTDEEESLSRKYANIMAAIGGLPGHSRKREELKDPSYAAVEVPMKLRCPGCLDDSVAYCSKECRSLHWVVHRKECSHCIHPVHSPDTILVDAAAGKFSSGHGAEARHEHEHHRSQHRRRGSLPRRLPTVESADTVDTGSTPAAKHRRSRSGLYHDAEADPAILSPVCHGCVTTRPSTEPSLGTGVQLGGSANEQTPPPSLGGNSVSSTPSSKSQSPSLGAASSPDISNGRFLPKYVVDAELIINALQGKPEGSNIYGALPSYVHIATDDTSKTRARTQCATFISRLWKYSYGLSVKELKAWLHVDFTWAEDFYEHITNGNGFWHIKYIHQVEPGDLIAMRYERTAANTGHIMIVASIERGSQDLTPIIDNTVQWKLKIVDSTRTHHMQQDTRYPPAIPGGIGSGYFRLFSDVNSGRIVGYCWSLWHKSIFYGEDGPREFAVGRPVQLLRQIALRASPIPTGPSLRKITSTARLHSLMQSFPQSQGASSVPPFVVPSSEPYQLGGLGIISSPKARVSGGGGGLLCEPSHFAVGTASLLSVSPPTMGTTPVMLGENLLGTSAYEGTALVPPVRSIFEEGDVVGADHQIAQEGILLESDSELDLDDSMRFSSGSEDSDFEPHSPTEETAAAGVHEKRNPWGSTTERAGTCLLADGDYKEASIVWYNIARTARIGLDLIRPMLNAATCYQLTGKYNAALRCAEKAITELKKIQAATTQSGAEMLLTHSAASADLAVGGASPSVTQSGLTSPTMLRVLRELWISALYFQGLAMSALGHHMQALRSYREALLFLVEWCEEEDNELFEEEDEMETVMNSIRFPWRQVTRAALANQINCALREVYPLVRVLRSSVAAVGRCLTAACDIPVNSFVVTEQPLLVWRHAAANDDPEEDHVSRILSQCLLRAYLHTCKLNQRQIMCLYTPTISVELAHTMRTAVKKAIQTFREGNGPELLAGFTVAQGVKLAIVAKCNAHRIDRVDDEFCAYDKPQPGEQYSALFDVMTKTEHSCRPNMYYDSSKGAYFAMRDIQEGEHLSFCYGGATCLPLSTTQRRMFLLQRYMFYCECDRCLEEDYSRGIACDVGGGCRGVRYPIGGTVHYASGSAEKIQRMGQLAGKVPFEVDPARGTLWRCNGGICGEYWYEDELSFTLKKESQLEEKLHALHDVVQTGQLVKNQFADLKAAMLEVESTLGHSHWLFSMGCKTMSRYFLNLAGSSKNVGTRHHTRKQAALWTEQYLQAARAQKLLEQIPMAVAEELFTLAHAWSKDECSLIPAQLKIFRFLYPLFLVLAEGTDACWILRETLEQSNEGLPSKDDAHRKCCELTEFISTEKFHLLLQAEEAKAKAKGSSRRRKHTGQYANPFALWTLVPEVGPEHTIADLFEEWEQYLSERVSQSLNTSARPNLPPELLNAMGRHNAPSASS